MVNTGEIDVDDSSLFLVDSLPSEVEFFNGDMDGMGPETTAIAFFSEGASLNLDRETRVKYSDQPVRPQTLNDCNYLPMTGYDDAVRHICFSPTGILGFSTPNPYFTVSFRVRIK